MSDNQDKGKDASDTQIKSGVSGNETSDSRGGLSPNQPAPRLGGCREPDATAVQGQESASDRSIAQSTRSIAWLTVAIVVVSLVSAVVSGFQWWEIHSGSADTKKLADAAKTQADAAVGQLGVIQDQLNVMKIDQRPWIGTPKIEPTVTGIPKKYTFNLSFKNVGKTPTTGFYIGAQTIDGALSKSEAFRICDKGRAFAKSNPEDFGAFTAIPGTDFAIGDAPGYIDVSFTRSELQEKKISHPYIVGCVIYKSRFDQEFHQTIFSASLKFINENISVQSNYAMYVN
jgi:hypothetical protein